jgi:hypothetical protein
LVFFISPEASLSSWIKFESYFFRKSFNSFFMDHGTKFRARKMKLLLRLSRKKFKTFNQNLY